MKYLLLPFLGIFPVAAFFLLLNRPTPPVEKELIVCHPVANSQNKALQNTSVAEDFTQLAATTNFAALHEAPLPLHLTANLGKNIRFACADGVDAGAYYIPSKEASVNFLIVIQEWWGLNDHIRQEAERYYQALEGNVHVIAVDLYDGQVAATVDSAQKLIAKAFTSKRKEQILQGTMDYAGKGANIYTVGWCFGGMMSLQTAIMGGNRVKGCIMYYGQPEKDETKIAAIQCDVLGIFGTLDKGIPNEAVDAFDTKMKSAGKHFTLYRYDAVHAFANPSNPGYNKTFGDDAFAKSIAFLKQKLR